MSNSYTGIFPTLVAAFDDAQRALVSPNVLIETVYTDFATRTAQLYDTINLNFPSSSYTASDVGAGTVSLQDVTATPITVQLNKHPAVWFKLPDYDTMRGYGVQQLRAMFVDEAVQKTANYINGQIAALITSGNFSQVVAGGTDDYITPTEAAQMRGKLVVARCPVRDKANMYLVVHPAIYQNLLPNTAWTGGNTVSPAFGSAARIDADLVSVFGATPREDLDMPVATGVYTSLMYHRNAFALASRALESPQAGGIASMQYVWKGLPLRITIDWNQQYLAYCMTVDALFGVSVFRSGFACRHTST